MARLRPQSMILTLLGDYVRHTDGCIWIGSLVQILGCLGVSAQGVRSAVSRMKQDDLLQSQNVRGKSFYSLTPKSSKLLDEGATRIFEFPRARAGWDGQWHLVTYTIPEVSREARDELRHELEWMGFGMLTLALWISPYDQRAKIESLADSLKVRACIEMFTARHDGFADPQTIVARCWDLQAINARYATFIQKYKTLYAKDCRALTKSSAPDPAGHFVRRFNLIHEFRRFPFFDPDLPTELLPADWRGTEAARLFHEYHDLLANQANAYFQSAFVAPANNKQKIRAMGR